MEVRHRAPTTGRQFDVGGDGPSVPLLVGRGAHPRHRRPRTTQVQGGETFQEETVPLLPACGETDDEVVDAAVTALGHLGGTSGLPAVLALVAHPSTRLAVARALPNLVDDDPLESIVAALTSLTTDLDNEIRDWATFGLGVLLEVDSPTVREALVARIDDEGGDTAGEALLGLATRHDERALVPVLERPPRRPGQPHRRSSRRAWALGCPSTPGASQLHRLGVERDAPSGPR